eukprot:4611721-Prymnesium_polylepis.1
MAVRPSRRPRDERHGAFAQFIATELGLRPDADRVIDVAGGKGRLSAALVERGLRSLLVDPCAETGRDVVRDGLYGPGATGPHDGDDVTLPHVGDDATAESAAPPPLEIESAQPLLVARQTMRQLLDSDRGETVARCGAIVGLHPDEATEEIVDAALSCELPFAVVPC